MKVRFYCDMPAIGIRLPLSYGNHGLWATTVPASVTPLGYKRVAFDVDMPPELVLPTHDLAAPADAAKVVDEGEVQP